MRYGLTAAVFALLFCSCAVFEKKSVLDEEISSRKSQSQEEIEAEKKKRALDAEVRRRFALVRRLIDSREFAKTEEVLSSLELMTEYEAELAELRRLLKLARMAEFNSTDLAIHQRRVLNEAEQGLALPNRYGASVQITPDDSSPELPEGPLEALLKRKVSMKVTNMPLSELALQLRDIDGLNLADPLNIIFSDEVVKEKTFSCNFRDVPLYEVFSYISKNLGISFNVTEHLIWVTAAPKEATAVKLETRVVKLRHGFVPQVPAGIGVTGKTSFSSVADESDSDLEQALKDFYGKNTTGGYYKIFPNRNLLLITDTRENIRKLEKLIAHFDKPPYQVVIESKFISVSESDLFDLGVEITKRNGGKTGSEYTSGNNEMNLSNFFTELGTIKNQNPDGVSGLMVSGILGNRSYDTLITAIQSKSSAVTLSAPRVTVLNNRTARIRKGLKYFYFEEYALQSVNKGDLGIDQVLVPKGKPTSLQTGITFDVKVNVGNDAQTIMLGLKPEIITLDAWENYSTQNSETVNKTTSEYTASVHLPRTNEQGIATSVVVHSGETVVLGGMVEHVKSRIVRKVPLLGDLPFIGWLFRHTADRETPTNLLIFVTAHVINENGEYVRFVPPVPLTPADVTPLKPVENGNSAKP